MGYSIEAGAWIMNHLITKYGSYELALARYAHSTKTFNKYKNTPYKLKYVRDVMGKEEM